MPTQPPRKLRSQEWWSGSAYENYARRAWLRAEGFGPNVFDNKPVIGICNSWSELNNCNVHLRTVAEAVKRGVWAAGGVPLEFPTISLGEMFMRPTTMLYRNLMAMDVEESIRANPIDGVVLLGGGGLVAAAQQDDAVNGIGADGFLHVHSHQVAIKHGGGAHEDFAERDGGKLQRKS